MLQWGFQGNVLSAAFIINFTENELQAVRLSRRRALVTYKRIAGGRNK